MSESRSTVDTVLALALVGGAAYMGYRYVYVPAQMRAELQREADRLQRANPGLSRPDALRQAAALACQVVGMKYGMPPGASTGLCGELGNAAAGIIRGLPQITGDLARAQISVLTMPLKVVGGVASEAFKPVKAGAKAVGKGAKAVANFFSKIF